jgi:TolB-like protein/Tfp pilus assembly protein PilF
VKIDNFFAELKRRNVVRMAGLYLVGAWLLTQVASTVLPMFGAAEWLPRSIVILLAIGFLPALIFSWVFEMTPQGLKRDEDVPPEESIAPQTARRMNRMIIAALVLALGYFAVDKFVLAPRRSPAPGELSSTASSKSIAVLPFNNLSDDKSNAYFADGIQDEILTRLAKIAELKVISRTSTQHFKSAPENLPEIARQLGVTNILEGSIQRSGDQVRITVQLINALNDSHLWAESYDRKLTDIFAVESEIARTVAETLQAKLTGSAAHVLAARPTENPEAHQLYLKGRYFWNRRAEESMKEAINYFQQAIALDPSYALAYAGLADAYALMPVYGRNPPKEDIHRSLAAARHAVELDDTLAEAHTALANALVDDLQFAAADREFARAIALNPSYATAHQWFGESLQTQGRFQESFAEIKKAHDLDPLSLIINCVLGSSLSLVGHHDEAALQLHRTLEMDPNFSVAQFILGQVLEDDGKLQDAAAAYEKAKDALPSPMRLAMLACLDIRLKKTAEARAILADLTSRAQRGYVGSYSLALIEAALGDKEAALRLLEQACDERSIQLGGNTGSLKIDKRLDSLREDPRFQKLLARAMGEAQ